MALFAINKGELYPTRPVLRAWKVSEECQPWYPDRLTIEKLGADYGKKNQELVVLGLGTN